MMFFWRMLFFENILEMFVSERDAFRADWLAQAAHHLGLVCGARDLSTPAAAGPRPRGGRGGDLGPTYLIWGQG